jgi:hypothetical protein
MTYCSLYSGDGNTGNRLDGPLLRPFPLLVVLLPLPRRISSEVVGEDVAIVRGPPGPVGIGLPREKDGAKGKEVGLRPVSPRGPVGMVLATFAGDEVAEGESGLLAGLQSAQSHY